MANNEQLRKKEIGLRNTENLPKITVLELRSLEQILSVHDHQVEANLSSQLLPLTSPRQINSVNFKGIQIHDARIASGPDINFESNVTILGIGFQLQGFGTTTYMHENGAYTCFMPPMTYNMIYQKNNVKGQHHLQLDSVYHFFHIGFTPDRFMELIASSQVLTEQYGRILDEESIFVLKKDSPKMSTPLLQSLEALRQIDFNNPLAEMLAEAIIMSIIVHVHTSSEEKTTPKEARLLHEIKNYLEENYLESITLKGLCRQFGINECALKKNFKTQFNQTIFGYIQQLRMEKAKNLLLSGKSIKEVSAEVGYEHPQHFSTAFRKWYHIKPSEWV
jgi:AraC-like DNA-binding protein